MNKIEFGDCRETMRRWAAEGIKVQTCVTSPPYFGLRDYGHDGQIGLEQTPDEYIAAMVEVFRCVWDVLADDGTLWVNIGDSYSTKHESGTTDEKKGWKSGELGGNRQKKHGRANGGNIPAKNLIGIPWMLAFALRADGWYLRQDIIWHKPNPMPESVKDRCTKAHEYIFLLSKFDRYFFDNEAIKEPLSENSDVAYRNKLRKDKQYDAKSPYQKNFPANFDETGRNRRSVWSVATRPYKGAHFATFPPALIEPCILAGSREGDIVLDPFMGSGTTAQVALQHGRQYLGCELNEDYKTLQDERIASAIPQPSPQIDMFSEVA